MKRGSYIAISSRTISWLEVLRVLVTQSLLLTLVWPSVTWIAQVNIFLIKMEKTSLELQDMPLSQLTRVKNSLEEMILRQLDMFYCTLLKAHYHGKGCQEEAKMKNTQQLKRKRLKPLSKNSAEDNQVSLESSWSTVESWNLSKSLTIGHVLASLKDVWAATILIWLSSIIHGSRTD